MMSRKELRQVLENIVLPEFRKNLTFKKVSASISTAGMPKDYYGVEIILTLRGGEQIRVGAVFHQKSNGAWILRLDEIKIRHADISSINRCSRALEKVGKALKSMGVIKRN